MKRPITTLFMLQSLDGKISSGSSDNLDVDKDFCKIDGVKEGLHQYYELEAETDTFSLNTGRVMAKIGVNDKKEYPKKITKGDTSQLHLKNLFFLRCNWDVSPKK